ncbi:protein-L-isoaspartate(D-aspartate) O-methyltransferase [Bacteroidota bacterium]
MREKMVKYQIEGRGITDTNVLNAMRNVERHLFVDKELHIQAYNDYPLGIGEGQTISQPYIVALMTEMLALNENDKVLEVGTGSGYQAAILGEIVDSVFTIEIYESLGKHSNQLLRALGYKNVFVKIGDGYQGWPENAPFNGIIVTCAPTHIPDPLINQLKEGGRLVIPVGESYYQQLEIFKKKDGKLKRIDTVPVRFVPMINKEGQKY